MSEKEKCGEAAPALVLWPGQAPLAMCDEHRAKAVAVADAMGFALHFRRAEDGATCEHAKSQ